MNKLDLNIVRLNLLLAEIKAKKETLQATRKQYEDQIAHLVSFTIHEETSVDRSLPMLLDIDARMQDITRQEHYLELLQNAAQKERESLQLTKLIEEARVQLLELRRQYDNAPQDEETAGLLQEIRRLEEIIAVASGAAAKSISESVSR